MIEGTSPNVTDAISQLEVYKQQNPQYTAQIDSVIEDVKSVERALEYQEVADISSKVLMGSGFTTLQNIKPIADYLRNYFDLKGMQLKHND